MALLARMELNVAATCVTAAHIPTRKVTVGQLDLEDVAAARLALVANAHSRRARLAVNGDVVVYNPAIRIVGVQNVAGYRRSLDMLASASVREVQVPPQFPTLLLDATGDGEIGV